MISASKYEALKDELSHRGQVVPPEWGLKPIGYGSSREVYALEVKGRPRSALKVVLLSAYLDDELQWSELDDQDREGAAQMVAEIKCLDGLRGHALVPRLVDWGGIASMPLWVETELLAPEIPGLDFDASFKQATGVPWSIFRKAVQLTHRMQRRDVGERHKTVADYVLPRLPPPVEPGAAAFLRELGEVVAACDLIPGDLEQPDNWGFTPSGEIKILDLGLAEPRPTAAEGAALKRRLMR